MNGSGSVGIGTAAGIWRRSLRLRAELPATGLARRCEADLRDEVVEPGDTGDDGGAAVERSRGGDGGGDIGVPWDLSGARISNSLRRTGAHKNSSRRFLGLWDEAR